MPSQTLNKTRLNIIDELRGAAVILMIIYHALYDLNVIFNLPLAFLFSPLMDLFRNCFISGPFIFIAGISANLSRNSLKRGITAFCLGLALTAATFIIAPSQLILFGILHMLGLSMIITHFLKPLLNKLPPKSGAAASAVLFFVLYGIPYRYIGLGSLLKIKLPDFLYSTNYPFPLGVHTSDFISSDYYPLLPWIFLFFAGFYTGRYLTGAKLPELFYRSRSKAIGWIGRHSMIIYLAHQPLLLALLYILFKIIRQT